ncbi:MAG: long-chain fatty acid--CoA ligase [Pyrinomonadaceae bacterium]
MGSRRSVRRIPLFADEPANLAELFYFALDKYDRPDALTSKKDGKWESISSRELVEGAEAIAAGMMSLGIDRGDRVAILAPNSPEWTITDAACQISGVVDVPIYTTLVPDSVAYIINDSGARILFLQNRESYLHFEEAIRNCPTLEYCILFEEPDVEPPNSMTLGELMRLAASVSADFRAGISEIKPHDTATLIYTSGTTGEPKGVVLSHENLLSNVIDAGEHFGFTTDDVPLSVLPLSHVFERTGMYLYIFNGMGVHYAESIEKVADNLKEVRPTVFVGVPRIFEKVYARAKLMAANSSPVKEKIFDWAIDVAKEYALRIQKGDEISASLEIKYRVSDKIVFSRLREFFGGRLKFCITGGAALSDSIFLIFTGAGISIMQGYGLTETSPVISTNHPGAVRLGTVGKPIRNVEVRIADDGEIEVTGPNIMQGYYNKPDATREAFSEDGWFKTGDIGEIDPEGFLKITDRKKELFKTSGGKYIAPSRIEQMIKGSRFVSQVVLIGNSRKFASALIVPDFEQLSSYARSMEWRFETPNEFCASEEVLELFVSEVDEHCTGLARFETVKKVVLLEEELTVKGGELTPTLKIKRRVVDEKYKDLIDGIYGE